MSVDPGAGLRAWWARYRRERVEPRVFLLRQLRTAIGPLVVVKSLVFVEIGVSQIFFPVVALNATICASVVETKTLSP